MKIISNDTHTKERLETGQAERRRFIEEQTIDVVEAAFKTREMANADDEENQELDDMKNHLTNKINAYADQIPKLYRHLDNCANMRTNLQEEIAKAREELRSLKIMNQMYQQQ